MTDYIYASVSGVLFTYYINGAYGTIYIYENQTPSKNLPAFENLKTTSSKYFNATLSKKCSSLISSYYLLLSVYLFYWKKQLWMASALFNWALMLNMNRGTIGH